MFNRIVDCLDNFTLSLWGGNGSIELKPTRWNRNRFVLSRKCVQNIADSVDASNNAHIHAQKTYTALQDDIKAKNDIIVGKQAVIHNLKQENSSLVKELDKYKREYKNAHDETIRVHGLLAEANKQIKVYKSLKGQYGAMPPMQWQWSSQVPFMKSNNAAEAEIARLNGELKLAEEKLAKAESERGEMSMKMETFFRELEIYRDLKKVVKEMLK